MHKEYCYTGSLFEEWRPVKGYEGLYEVSNCGRVRSLNYRQKTGNVVKLKQATTKKGYKQIGLWKDKKQKRHYVHRLVWEAFNGPIPAGMEINHLDERKDNNWLDNLEVCTPKENSNWGTGVKRLVEKRSKNKRWLENVQKAAKIRSQNQVWRENYYNGIKKRSNRKDWINNHWIAMRKCHSKQILQLDNTTGEIIKVWNCIRDVERKLGIKHQNIVKCCKGKYSQTGGFKWRYVND